MLKMKENERKCRTKGQICRHVSIARWYASHEGIINQIFMSRRYFTDIFSLTFSLFLSLPVVHMSDEGVNADQIYNVVPFSALENITIIPSIYYLYFWLIQSNSVSFKWFHVLFCIHFPWINNSITEFNIISIASPCRIPGNWPSCMDEFTFQKLLEICPSISPAITLFLWNSLWKSCESWEE